MWGEDQSSTLWKDDFQAVGDPPALTEDEKSSVAG